MGGSHSASAKRIRMWARVYDATSSSPSHVPWRSMQKSSKSANLYAGLIRCLFCENRFTVFNFLVIVVHSLIRDDLTRHRREKSTGLLRNIDGKHVVESVCQSICSALRKRGNSSLLYTRAQNPLRLSALFFLHPFSCWRKCLQKDPVIHFKCLPKSLARTAAPLLSHRLLVSMANTSRDVRWNSPNEKVVKKCLNAEWLTCASFFRSCSPLLRPDMSSMSHEAGEGDTWESGTVHVIASSTVLCFPFPWSVHLFDWNWFHWINSHVLLLYSFCCRCRVPLLHSPPSPTSACLCKCWDRSFHSLWRLFSSLSRIKRLEILLKELAMNLQLLVSLYNSLRIECWYERRRMQVKEDFTSLIQTFCSAYNDSRSCDLSCLKPNVKEEDRDLPKCFLDCYHIVGNAGQRTPIAGAQSRRVKAVDGRKRVHEDACHLNGWCVRRSKSCQSFSLISADQSCRLWLGIGLDGSVGSRR